MIVNACDPTFDKDELRALDVALEANLEYWHETLRDDYKTVATAMAKWDNDPAVTALIKINPAKAAEMRAYAVTYLKEYLEEGTR